MSAQYGADDAPPPPELRPLAAGDPERVGAYTLAGRLADDGVSTLYGALDPSGAPIAVRVAGASQAADSGFRSAFARRVDALGGVSGVCVLPLLAADPDAERPWLATALPVGPTLRERVERAGPLDRDALFALAAGTAEALTAVHGAGLGYGGIAPDDIVLGPEGPLVLGLGAVDGAGGSAFAPVGPTASAEQAAPIGQAAAAWASPERADGAAAAPSGDVFSWGCLITYAATGRHPYAAPDTPESDLSALRQRVDQGVPDLSGITEELGPLIGLAVAADPGARPTAESIYRGLVAFAASDDTAQVPTPELSGRLGALLVASWSGAGAGQAAQAPWSAARAPAAGAAPAVAGSGRADSTSDADAGDPGGTARPGAPKAPGVGAPDASPSRPSPAADATGAASEPAAPGPLTDPEPEPAPADSAAPPAPGLRRAGAAATAMVTASSMATVLAIGAGGFLAVGAFTGGPGAAPSAAPSSSSAFGTADEAVADAVKALESAENYRAVDEVEGGGQNAGEQREYVLATLAGREHFQSITLLGDPEAPAAGSTARIYEPENGRLIQREFGGGVEGRYYASSGEADEATAWPTSRKPVLAPFTGMRESMDVTQRIEGRLNGTPGLHITGTFGFTARGEAGTEEYTDAPFDLWIDEEGRPLRLAYTAGGTEHNWTYSGFGGLDSRICGVVEGVPDLERAYLVPTRAGIACGDVRPVVEEYLAIPEEEQQAAGYVAEVGEWTCRLSPLPDGSAQTQGAGADVGACYRGAIGAAERVDLVELE